MPIKLCTMFGRLLCWYIVTLYIHFRGLLPPDGILPRAKFTLRPSLAFSYISSVTARQSSSGSAKLCGIELRAPPIFDRAAITLGIGPHSSCKDIRWKKYNKLTPHNVSNLEIDNGQMVDHKPKIFHYAPFSTVVRSPLHFSGPSRNLVTGETYLILN